MNFVWGFLQSDNAIDDQYSDNRYVIAMVVWNRNKNSRHLTWALALSWFLAVGQPSAKTIFQK